MVKPKEMQSLNPSPADSTLFHLNNQYNQLNTINKKGGKQRLMIGSINPMLTKQMDHLNNQASPSNGRVGTSKERQNDINNPT